MCYIPPRIHIRLTVTEEHTLCNKHIAQPDVRDKLYDEGIPL